jgi:adenylate cyclase
VIPSRETPQTLWELAGGALDASRAAAAAAIRAATQRYQNLLGQSGVDFAAEGLLAGAEDPAARQRLLQELYAAGVPLEELREAVARDRLALVPLEAVLRSERQISLEELARRAGLEPAVLERWLRALGVGFGERDRELGDRAADAVSALAELRDAGLGEEAVEELCLTAGRCVDQVAHSAREVFGAQFLHAGEGERDLGLRYAAVARQLLPTLSPILSFVLRSRLLALVREDVVSRAEQAAGELPGGRRIAVCFADIAGFTGLGQRLEPEDVGSLVRRFDALVARRTPAGVSHVKTVGDAAMLVGSDVQQVLHAARELAVATPGEGLPAVHAGVAVGQAVARGGDWYGHPVNLASHLAEAAPVGHVYVSAAVRDATRTRMRYVGRLRLKGLGEAIEVFDALPGERRGSSRRQRPLDGAGGEVAIVG